MDPIITMTIPIMAIGCVAGMFNSFNLSNANDKLEKASKIINDEYMPDNVKKQKLEELFPKKKED